MSSGDAEIRRLLRDAIGLLERGNWRAVLRPPGSGDGVVAGPRQLVVFSVALDLIALSMQCQAQGRPEDAWDRLDDAAAVLPAQLTRQDGSTGAARAVLAPEPSAAMPVDEQLACRLARLVWREQVELEALKATMAGGRTTPRDELVEACIEHLCWVEFDHGAFYRVVPGQPPWDDGTTVDRLRSVLCLRGTRLRRFADPTAGRLSQAMWQDIGGYRGLCAAAYDRLADRPAPAPWWGTVGTSGLPVRRGRLRAWHHARDRRHDLGAPEIRPASPLPSP